MIVLAILILAGIGIAVGLALTFKQRNAGRQHRFAFLGYFAGVVALVASVVIFWAAMPFPGLALRAFAFIAVILALLCWLFMLVAGILSAGLHRVLLILYGVALAVVYLLASFANLGA